MTVTSPRIALSAMAIRNNNNNKPASTATLSRNARKDILSATAPNASAACNSAKTAVHAAIAANGVLRQHRSPTVRTNDAASSSQRRPAAAVVRKSRSVTPVRDTTTTNSGRNAAAAVRKAVMSQRTGLAGTKRIQQQPQFPKSTTTRTGLISARVGQPAGGPIYKVIPSDHQSPSSAKRSMQIALRQSGSDTVLNGHHAKAERGDFSSPTMLFPSTTRQKLQMHGLLPETVHAFTNNTGRRPQQTELDSTILSLRQSIAVEDQRRYRQQHHQQQQQHNSSPTTLMQTDCAYAQHYNATPNFAEQQQQQQQLPSPAQTHSGGGDVEQSSDFYASVVQYSPPVEWKEDAAVAEHTRAPPRVLVNSAAAAYNEHEEEDGVDEDEQCCNCSDNLSDPPQQEQQQQAESQTITASIVDNATNIGQHSRQPPPQQQQQQHLTQFRQNNPHSAAIKQHPQQQQQQQNQHQQNSHHSRKAVHEPQQQHSNAATIHRSPVPHIGSDRSQQQQQQQVRKSRNITAHQNVVADSFDAVTPTAALLRSTTIAAPAGIAHESHDDAKNTTDLTDSHHFTDLMKRAERLAHDRIFGAASAHHDEVVKLRALLDEVLSRFVVAAGTNNSTATTAAPALTASAIKTPATLSSSPSAEAAAVVTSASMQLIALQQQLLLASNNNNSSSNTAAAVAATTPVIVAQSTPLSSSPPAAAAAELMHAERELQRTQCLLDIQNQHLERQQLALDRRQQIATHARDQQDHVETRLQQLESRFERQKQELERTYQSNLSELEKKTTDLQRQLLLQQQQPVALTPSNSSVMRENERLRHEFAESRLEHDAETRALRDESQKLRLQLNDAKHQCEQVGVVSEEHEKEWRRERKQLETDREALIEKLNQRVKQLTQLWQEHRTLQEQFKDSTAKNETLARDQHRLLEENKVLTNDVRNFQRESVDAVQSLNTLRASMEQKLNSERQQYTAASKHAHDSMLNLSTNEQERMKQYYQEHFSKLDEIIREQRTTIEKQQQDAAAAAASATIRTESLIINNTDAAAKKELAKVQHKQNSRREKVRKALLNTTSHSSSEIDNDAAAAAGYHNENNHRRARSSADGFGADAPAAAQRRSSFTSWRQLSLSAAGGGSGGVGENKQRPPLRRAQSINEVVQAAEHFHHQYEQLRVALEQRALADQNALRNSLLEEKTREVAAFNAELAALKRQLRDAEQHQYHLQQRMEHDAHHMRKAVNDLRTKYDTKSALVVELNMQIAHLTERLKAAEQAKSEQMLQLEKSVAAATAAAAASNSAAARLQHQQQNQQEQQLQQEANEQERSVFKRMNEQLRQMETRLQKSELQANDWQQKFRNIQEAFVQVYGN